MNGQKCVAKCEVVRRVWYINVHQCIEEIGGIVQPIGPPYLAEVSRCAASRERKEKGNTNVKSRLNILNPYLRRIP